MGHMRLIGEMEPVGNGGKSFVAAAAHRGKSGAGADVGTVGFRRAAISGSKAAAQRFGAHALFLGPARKREGIEVTKIVGEHVGPVERRRRCGDEHVGKMRRRCASVAFGDALYADAIEFEKAPSNSIDYAVMEKDDRVAVVPVAMGWSDLGSWHTIHELAEKDNANNAITGDAFLHDSRGNLVRAGDKRISILGMDNIAVIVDGDDILIIPLERSQEVRAAAKARE